MTLEQLSFAAQIISAIAVIASLIFVGLQLQHAASAIRLSSSQAHSAPYIELVRSVVENAEFSRIWTAALTDPAVLKDEEWARFVSFAGAFFRLYEASRVQWKNRQLDEEHFARSSARQQTSDSTPVSEKPGTSEVIGTLPKCAPSEYTPIAGASIRPGGSSTEGDPASSLCH